MYEAFFGLRETPFDARPQPRQVVCRSRQRALIARLRGALIEQGHNCALVGVAGAGKSTLARLLLRALPEGTAVTFLERPPASARQLLEHLLGSTRADRPLRELVAELRERLLAQHRAGQAPVLVIDDAHLLAPELLTQLQRLLSARIRGRRALPALLLGRHATAGNLARGGGSFLDLADRVEEYGVMDVAETREYVRYKLRAAGGEPALVTPAALRLLHKRSRGIPRHVDIACEKAFATAYLQDSEKVDAREVRLAFSEPVHSAEQSRQLPAWAVFALPVLLALAGTAGLLSWWASLGAAKETQAAAPAPPGDRGIVLPGRGQGGEAVVRLADLAMSERTSRRVAERRLLARWGEQHARTLEEPLCRQVREMAFECMQGWGSWQDLERLNRPAVLTLWHSPQRSFHAVVARLDPKQVTLDIDGEMHSFSRQEVQRLWHGEFLVLWRPPLAGVEVINAGSDPAAVTWLRQALGRLEGRSAAPAAGGEFDWPLVKQIMAFQSRVGLEADGTVGPSTFIALTSALGTESVPTINTPALN